MSEKAVGERRGRGRMGSRWKHPLPLWMRVGDNISEVVVLLILAGGFLCEGYVNESRYMMRAWAWTGCALLGLWSLAGYAFGRWDAPEMRVSRIIMLVFGLVIAWTGVQLIPLPSSWVAGVSSSWAETRRAFAETGLDFPSRIPLAHNPERGLRSWHQVVAAALFYAGIAPLAARRTCSMRLVMMVALVSVVEGIWGMCGQYFWKNRAMGAIFNPNHHAALSLMGLPVYFTRMIQWKRFNPATQDAPLISGTHPMILFLGIGMVAMLGWLNALSRGSLLLGGSVLVLWAAVEIIGNWRDSKGAGGHSMGPGAIILAGAGYCILLLSLTMLLISSSVLENVLSRSSISDEMQGQGRLELWKAMLRAIGENPVFGIGLAGTEPALNRFTELPMGSVPIWAHNDYVQVVAELGLPAAAAVLVLAGFALGVLTLQWAAQLREVPWILGLVPRACTAGVLITLAHSAVDFHLRIPLIGFTFLTLLALAVNQGPLLISPRMYSRLLPFKMPTFRRES